MGMIVRITVFAPSETAGQQACRAAFERIAYLDREVFSDYQAKSELRRLSGARPGHPTPVSAPLASVLEASLRLADQTEGRYDPTAKPLIQLWRLARREGRLPESDRIQEAHRLVDYRGLALDPQSRTLALDRAGMEIDLGSIAKGYIADQALTVLRSRGFPAAMIEAGGDLVLGDPPPDHQGWPVSPPGSDKDILLSNCAISTSGDSSQFLDIDGIRYSHVIDARTGMALTNHHATVVIAPSGLLSDGLATVGGLLPEPDFQSLVRDAYPRSRGWHVPLGAETDDAAEKATATTP